MTFFLLVTHDSDADEVRSALDALPATNGYVKVSEKVWTVDRIEREKVFLKASEKLGLGMCRHLYSAGISGEA